MNISLYRAVFYLDIEYLNGLLVLYNLELTFPFSLYMYMKQRPWTVVSFNNSI